MDPVTNPYRPGAGTKPLVLAGREAQSDQVSALLESVSKGAPQRSLMFYGLRGVGKTVLLNQGESMARDKSYVVEHIEMSEDDDFRRVIAKATRKVLTRLSTAKNLMGKAITALGVLKAFSLKIPDGPEFKIDVDAAVGFGDSGDLDTDLVDLFEAVGDAANEVSRHVCFLIDEVQYLSEKASAGLIASSHRITQRGLPVVFICAGLPQIAALAGEAKSYAERLFEFIPVASLNPADAENALRGPALAQGVEFTPAAVAELLRVAEGYPYFIQELGKHAWNIAGATPISEGDAQKAVEMAIAALDRSFFKVRLDRATPAERKFMTAMATPGRGPYKIADVAARMNRQVSSLGPVRATLISKGFVYSQELGYVEFTVPQFDDFIRRHFKISMS